MIHPEETYKAFAEFYDLYVGAYKEDLDFYRSLCSCNDKIIEIGCGTGRILKYLLDKQFKVTGIDVSKEMLDIAVKKLGKYIEAGTLHLEKLNFLNDHFPQVFHKAFITFYTFNYIIDKPVDFLRNVYKSLCKDGLIVIDAFYPKTFVEKFLENKWSEQELKTNEGILKIRDKRFVKDNLEHRIQVFTNNQQSIEIETVRRYFPPAELKEYLREAGFRNIEFSLIYDKMKFTKEINGVNLKQNYLVRAIRDK